ncbi:MAG: DNA polymerase III subunit delta' [Deltaproteobacteria bacterium]|nr:DNA polymerase III subunit delta' [Deltaproteobacteria bacterium]
MPDSFSAVLAQDPAVTTLRRALEHGRVHHAYRFEGPEGVGKELAAFALAQALVCESESGRGCGACSACRRAVRLTEGDPAVPQHPDVVLLGRGLYPAAALGAQTRETSAIGVEQIRRLVTSRVTFPPHEGRAMVFIIRDAHELSQGAANALLKTLEEPPQRVHFVLLTSDPSRLLDTIRSRTLAVRFGPLPDAVVARVLEQRGLPIETARAAEGSLATALSLSDEATRARRAAFIEGAEAARVAPSLDRALAFAAARPEDRDTLRADLLALAQAEALSARDLIRTEPDQAARHAERYEVVRRAMAALDRNAQPALTIEAMLVGLRAR